MEFINLSRLVQDFFEERLIRQKGVSKYTLASYSFSFRLLFQYACEQLKKRPEQLVLQDLDAQLVNSFLNHIEEQRDLKPQSRNVYLNAIRSFFHYLSFKLPEIGNFINAVLDIHKKKVKQKLINFLTFQESEALLAAIDQNTRLGRRDHTLLLLAIETGLRLSELINLKWGDVNWTSGSIKCIGKGRKEREVYIRDQTLRRLRLWHDENEIENTNTIFPTRYGIMSSDTFQYLVKKYTRVAVQRCPSIGLKAVTPHVLRHTAIMRALHSGVDLAKIALWVGHESMRTTYGYLIADVNMKEEILRKVQPLKTRAKRYKADSDIVAYLKRFNHPKPIT